MGAFNDKIVGIYNEAKEVIQSYLKEYGVYDGNTVTIRIIDDADRHNGSEIEASKTDSIHIVLDDGYGISYYKISSVSMDIRDNDLYVTATGECEEDEAMLSEVSYMATIELADVLVAWYGLLDSPLKEKLTKEECLMLLQPTFVGGESLQDHYNIDLISAKYEPEMIWCDKTIRDLPNIVHTPTNFDARIMRETALFLLKPIFKDGSCIATKYNITIMNKEYGGDDENCYEDGEDGKKSWIGLDGSDYETIRDCEEYVNFEIWV